MIRSFLGATRPLTLLARGLVVFMLLHLAFAFLSRVALTIQGRADISWEPLAIIGSFAWGLWYDLQAALFTAGVWGVVSLLVPAAVWRSNAGRWLFAGIAAGYGVSFLFSCIGEWLFWEEFQVRFNFIAVDYLVFTQEVWENIDQSYPMPAVFAALAVVGTLIGWLSIKSGIADWVRAGDHGWVKPGVVAVGYAIAACIAATAFSQSQLPKFSNEFNRELAKNGTYSFCTSFWESEIDYDRFYRRLPEEQALSRARTLLATPDAPLANATDVHDLHRVIKKPTPEKKWNVMLVSVESLSAEFLQHYRKRPERTLTPRLDALCDEGLWLRDLYATGTRTVRGLEALTLSVPPTPGQSIVWREGKNENLFSLGYLFQQRGYDTAYVYGGDAKFDFMRYFFTSNGYRVVDRESKTSSDWTFNNAWGVADEDLFNWTLKEADADHAAGKPFYLHTMTVSNHRPFTFPEGHDGIVPDGNRDPALRYTDWCIGHFIDEAKKRPWFDNTLFVVVADHCHGSAGKAALDVSKYRIPCLFYAPKLIKPGVHKGMCSQIDIAPTIAGLLDWSYTTSFFGHDLLGSNSYPRDKRRAFVSNYQKIAVVTPGALALLTPKQGATVEAIDVAHGDAKAPAESDLANRLNDAVAWYQSASWIFGHGGFKAP
jgi:phosphoglycerol transferase MdoB-like AlkP superfamily enzyme